jgi:queuine/archaeosine tRNA-ribosyltransferase
LTGHNLTFFQDLVRAFRDSVISGNVLQFSAEFLRNYRCGGRQEPSR